MNEPRIVTPQEARRWESDPEHVPFDSIDPYSAARTIATEDTRWAERIAAAERAAVVKVLLPIRRYAESQAITARALGQDQRPWLDLLILIERAENGADL